MFKIRSEIDKGKMTNFMNSLLIFIAVGILIVLSAAAAHYSIKLRQVKKQQTDQTLQNKHAWLEHQEELAKDIRFIANAMMQEQCEITEGCLRLIYLMDRLDTGLQHKKEFKTLQMHYQSTSSMPHHEAYKALNKKQQIKLDQTRYELEKQNRQIILSEVTILSNYQFDRTN